MPNGSALRGPPGRAGAAKHQIQPDSHGHERTLNPQVGPTAPWLLDASKLAYKDEVTGSSPVTPTSRLVVKACAVVAEMSRPAGVAFLVRLWSVKACRRACLEEGMQGV
jgi:hypothetical protein